MSEETIIGMDKFTADLNKLSAAARSDVVLDALEAGGYVIAAHAQENARNVLNRHPMGNLTNNIGVRREGKFILAGVFGVVYAKVHEFGGVIVPRNKPYLVFQVDGEWRMTKSVHIPARPYMRPALDNHMPEIKQAVIDNLVGLLKRAI